MLSADDRIAAVSNLLLGLCRYCHRSGISSVFGVVFPSVARVIRQAGWPGELLSETRGDEEVLRLVQWTPSELVAWTIQERREQQEETCARRREAARFEQLVA